MTSFSKLIKCVHVYTWSHLHCWDYTTDKMPWHALYRQVHGYTCTSTSIHNTSMVVHAPSFFLYQAIFSSIWWSGRRSCILLPGHQLQVMLAEINDLQNTQHFNIIWNKAHPLYYVHEHNLFLPEWPHPFCQLQHILYRTQAFATG